MKEQAQSILDQLKPMTAFLKTRIQFIVVIVFILIYGGIVLKINQLSTVQPSATQINNNLNLTAPPKLDPKVLAKIQQLQANNIQVQTLFEQARNNPFSE